MDHPKKCFVCALIRYAVVFAFGIAAGVGFRDFFISSTSFRF